MYNPPLVGVLLFFLFFAFEQSLYGQEEGIHRIQSIESEKGKSHSGAIERFMEDYPNPNKALMLSLIFPGAGQVYNKKYIKLPFVYGALGGLIYVIGFNSQEYNRYKTAYSLKLDGDIHEFSGTILDNTTTLKRRRDDARKNMELSSILLVVTYLLNGLDAYVDAHLLDFNVNENLGFHIRPKALRLSSGFNPSPSLALTFYLKN